MNLNRSWNNNKMIWEFDKILLEDIDHLDMRYKIYLRNYNINKIIIGQKRKEKIYS